MHFTSRSAFGPNSSVTPDGAPVCCSATGCQTHLCDIVEYPQSQGSPTASEWATLHYNVQACLLAGCYSTQGASLNANQDIKIISANYEYDSANNAIRAEVSYCCANWCTPGCCCIDSTRMFVSGRGNTYSAAEADLQSKFIPYKALGYHFAPNASSQVYKTSPCKSSSSSATSSAGPIKAAPQEAEVELLISEPPPSVSEAPSPDESTFGLSFLPYGPASPSGGRFTFGRTTMFGSTTRTLGSFGMKFRVGLAPNAKIVTVWVRGGVTNLIPRIISSPSCVYTINRQICKYNPSYPSCWSRSGVSISSSSSGTTTSCSSAAATFGPLNFVGECCKPLNFTVNISHPHYIQNANYYSLPLGMTAWSGIYGHNSSQGYSGLIVFDWQFPLPGIYDIPVSTKDPCGITHYTMVTVSINCNSLVYNNSSSSSSIVCYPPSTTPVGACCSGSDCTQTTQAACSWTFKGIGVPCIPNPCASNMPPPPPPPPVSPSASGACCSGSACAVLTKGDCNAINGIYLGNNTKCSPNPCFWQPPNLGACCSGSTCTETTAANCNGVFKGAGVPCNPNPCLATGSSCASKNPVNCADCLQVIVHGYPWPALWGPSYQPTLFMKVPGLTWNGKPVYRVNVAFSGANTYYLFQDKTKKLVGYQQWVEVCSWAIRDLGASWTPLCPMWSKWYNPMGPPPWGPGNTPTLTTMGQVDCDCCPEDVEWQHHDYRPWQQPPVWLGWAVKVQACCNPSYSSGQCSAWPPTVGACCVGSDCHTLTPADCVASNGTYKGNNTVCAPGLCTPIVYRGACCSSEHCLPNMTAPACASIGGLWQGPNISCNSSLCLTPPSVCPSPCTSPDCCPIGNKPNFQGATPPVTAIHNGVDQTCILTLNRGWPYGMDYAYQWVKSLWSASYTATSAHPDNLNHQYNFARPDAPLEFVQRRRVWAIGTPPALPPAVPHMYITLQIGAASLFSSARPLPNSSNSFTATLGYCKEIPSNFSLIARTSAGLALSPPPWRPVVPANASLTSLGISGPLPYTGGLFGKSFNGMRAWGRENENYPGTYTIQLFDLTGGMTLQNASLGSYQRGIRNGIKYCDAYYADIEYRSREISASDLCCGMLVETLHHEKTYRDGTFCAWKNWWSHHYIFIQNKFVNKSSSSCNWSARCSNLALDMKYNTSYCAIDVCHEDHLKPSHWRSSYCCDAPQPIYPPTLGACCVSSVCIDNLSQPQCLNSGGTWFGGVFCTASPCSSLLAGQPGPPSSSKDCFEGDFTYSVIDERVRRIKLRVPRVFTEAEVKGKWLILPPEKVVSHYWVHTGSSSHSSKFVQYIPECGTWQYYKIIKPVDYEHCSSSKQGGNP